MHDQFEPRKLNSNIRLLLILRANNNKFCKVLCQLWVIGSIEKHRDLKENPIFSNNAFSTKEKRAIWFRCDLNNSREIFYRFSFVRSLIHVYRYLHRSLIITCKLFYVVIGKMLITRRNILQIYLIIFNLTSHVCINIQTMFNCIKIAPLWEHAISRLRRHSLSALPYKTSLWNMSANALLTNQYQDHANWAIWKLFIWRSSTLFLILMFSILLLSWSFAFDIPSYYNVFWVKWTNTKHSSFIIIICISSTFYSFNIDRGMICWAILTQRETFKRICNAMNITIPLTKEKHALLMGCALP